MGLRLMSSIAHRATITASYVPTLEIEEGIQQAWRGQLNDFLVAETLCPVQLP